MADFKQLALEFVLAEDASTQSNVARRAADGIQDGTGNPVLKWVESIKPWISGDGALDDDPMEDGEVGVSSGDIIARAKALRFLSSTLELLGKDTLKPSQLKLLIAFFGSMFANDHKAGILPSAKALTTLCTMPAFNPESGNDVIRSVCSLGDDFRKQAAETRLAIYELFFLLVTDAQVSSDLQYQHGEAGRFMTDIIQLCRSERDPKNIMLWLCILETFLTEYSPSADVTLEIFEAFSSYFPISLRTSNHPSGITRTDLKVALRRCFAAHDRVSGHAIPHLVQYLDRPEGGNTVDVKVDILETLKQCMKNYKHVHKSISPFVDKIWTSLKYEVRNGEVNEAINGTLDVIRAMTGRLDGDQLRDFVLTVLRECLEDLGNPTYAAQMGQLLVCAAGAKAGAFAMIVTPTVKTAKENLRHTKSKDHRRDLLGLLNAILDARLLFAGGEASLSTEDLDGLKSTDPILGGLYDECYKPNLDADKKVAKKAIEGMGLLVCQPSAVADGVLLVPEQTLQSITTALADILTNSSSDLADDAMVAMQKACMSWPPGFSALLSSSLGRLHAAPSTENAENLMTLVSRIAFVSCSELPRTGRKLRCYVMLLGQLLENMDRLLCNSDGPSQLWIIYPVAIQSSMRHLQDAMRTEFGPEAFAAEFLDSITRDSWVGYITGRYPSLPLVEKPMTNKFDSGIVTRGTVAEVDEKDGSSLHVEILLLSLLVTRHLYRRSTRIVEAEVNQEGEDPIRPEVTLSNELIKSRGNETWTGQYLHFLSALATHVVGQFDKAQQSRLCLQEDVFTLFRGGDRWGHEGSGEHVGSEYRDAVFHTLRSRSAFEASDLSAIPPSLGSQHLFPVSLSLGVLQPLHPDVLKPLFDGAFGLEFMASRLLLADSNKEDLQLQYLLMLFANKYSVERVPKLLRLLEHQMRCLADGKSTPLSGQPANKPFPPGARHHLAGNIFAVVAGILRRHLGSSLHTLYDGLRDAPSNPEEGHILARKFDLLFRPHPCLQPEYASLSKRMWPHSAFAQLVKPMIPLAWPKRSTPETDLVCANYSIAILSSVRHLAYEVYKEEVADLIRMVLCVLRTLPVGPDVEVALKVLWIILQEATDDVEPFLKSVIVACTEIIGNGTSDGKERVSWMPEGYMPVDRTGRAANSCRNLAIMLLGFLPRKFEQRHLLDSAPQMKMLLHRSCGDKVREIRKTALTARLAWADVQ